MNNLIDNSLDRKKMFYPVIYAEFYLSFILILYIFGPFEWRTHRPILFYTLILSFQIAIALGYFVGIKKRVNPIVGHQKKDIFIYLKYMIYFNFLYTIINAFNTVGMSSFSLSTYFNSIYNGIINPVQQYHMKFDNVGVSSLGGPFFSYISVFLAPFIWPTTLISIYYFKELSLVKKMIVVLTIFLEVTRWIGIGTNKGVIDIIIIILVVVLLNAIKKRDYKLTFKDTLVKHRKLLFIAILLIFGISFFSNNIISRTNENWYNLSLSNGGTLINTNSPIMRITPHFLQATMIIMTSYLTQGYYAFSLALELPFKPLFGIGNSMFLLENFHDFFGIDLYEFTYQYRMLHFNWDPSSNWHSFYTWVANDVHYIGVIFVMFGIGYLLARSYKAFLVFEDMLGLVLFCLTTLIIFYLPANNQILSYPTTFMAFWILLFYWGLRKKYKIVLKK